MSDIYDDIALAEWRGDQNFARAFRDFFARRTCATCEFFDKGRYCDHQVAVLDESGDEITDRATFSCQLYTPKATP